MLIDVYCLSIAVAEAYCLSIVVAKAYCLSIVVAKAYCLSIVVYTGAKVNEEKFKKLCIKAAEGEYT